VILSGGDQLGPYTILAPLGAGGMGEVYRAKDTRLDREVAIKVLPERLARDREALARFEQEAKAVAALSHPNILAIHDVGMERDVPFAVMELLKGETLRDRLGRAALPWRKAVEIAAGIADGLAAAHTKGIIHHDLKPTNVFVTSDGVIKILDFGLARVVQPFLPEEQAEASTITLDTSPRTVMGTVAYMSPEQVQGQATDARSDIFSFGCVLYEMLTGRRAFGRKTSAETVAAILRAEPPEIAEVGKPIPPELDRVIRHCLEKRPEERFQSARDLAFDLRAILSDSRAAQIYPGAARARLGAPLRVAIACLAVVAVAAVLIGLDVGGWRGRLFGPGAPGRIRSLAVLPLENLSGDPEQDYFVDGMTDALIADLAKISELRVISRTSMMCYRGTDKSLPEIARELNVDAVVEGSVLRAGNQVRITAQLIHGATDQHLWANSYEHELRDILGLQGEVARAIAQEIQIKVTPQEQARLARAQPVNPEAYEAYLKGRYHWNKRTEEGFRKAIDNFQQAIEIDPNYAAAYSGLADCYSLLADYGILRPDEAYPKAEAAASKALRIDDTLAEAHASLAMAVWQYDWDRSRAEKEFKRAIELNPGYATAHHWHALFLGRTGRLQEAIAEIKRAQELDPLSLIINTVTGMVFYWARQYDLAIQEYRKTLEMDPDFEIAHYLLGWVFGQKGLYDEAIAELRRAEGFSGGAAKHLARLAQVYAATGAETEARKILEQLNELSKQTYVPPCFFAIVCAGLGEKDQAFAWLDKACAERDSYLLDLKVDPIYDNLRSDPRFDEMVRRIGLEP
jgi:TolB-like protein/Tfp pilus assembly protein PilF/tRNA A-37 threonylcarbamoyl transferase component Bud32